MRTLLGGGFDLLSENGRDHRLVPGGAHRSTTCCSRSAPSSGRDGGASVERARTCDNGTPTQTSFDVGARRPANVRAARCRERRATRDGGRRLVVTHARLRARAMERGDAANGSRLECRDRVAAVSPTTARSSSKGRESSLSERCQASADGIAEQVADFDPDVVVVLSTIYDLQQRRLDGWDDMRVPGDPGFDEYLANEYANVYDVLSSGGARVVWMTNPCARTTIGPWPNDGRGGPLDEIARRTRQRRSSRTSSRTCAPTSGSSTCTQCCVPTARSGPPPAASTRSGSTACTSRPMVPGGSPAPTEPRSSSSAPADRMELDGPRAANLRNWESRVPVHAASQTYDVDGLVSGRKRLSDVVAFDEIHLGDLTGLDVVHLQCHIGTDTISLARLGARAVGLDFSPGALAVGRDLADRSGLEVTLRRRRAVRRGRRVGRGALRPRVHGDRSALLAARHPCLGRSGRAGCCGRVAGSTCERAIRCSGPPKSSGPGASS